MTAHRIGMILAGALVTLAGGCATVKVNMYDADEIEAIQAWHIDFSFEPGEYQQAIGTRRGVATTIIKEGYPPVDLQLRDDLFFALRDSYATTLVSNAEEAEGFIRLLPLHFTSGGYKSLQLLLTDIDREVLARIRVNNGNTSPIIKDNDKFAEFCSDALVKVLRSPYLQ